RQPVARGAAGRRRAARRARCYARASARGSLIGRPAQSRTRSELSIDFGLPHSYTNDEDEEGIASGAQPGAMSRRAQEARRLPQRQGGAAQHVWRLSEEVLCADACISFFPTSRAQSAQQTICCWRASKTSTCTSLATTACRWASCMRPASPRLPTCDTASSW